MLNSKLLVLFLLSLFLLSCNENNKKKEYYDTGELYMIEKLIDKKTIFGMPKFTVRKVIWKARVILTVKELQMVTGKNILVMVN